MPFIKDAIYSYMAFPEYFAPLIDSLPVQRLRRIRQLAGTEYVYPGATHTRFEHSLGVMYLAGKLCHNLNEHAVMTSGAPLLSNEEVKEVMVAALLHDVGHGPFSHLFENLYEGEKTDHEDISRRVIREYLASDLERMDLDPDRIARLATGGEIEAGRQFMSQVIAGTIDCDSLDYLVRDSYYTGALVGTLDVSRILLMTRVLNGNLVFDMKIGLPILEGYFLVRLNSFKQIYYHKTSRAAQIMMRRAMENHKEEFSLGKFDSIADFLKWDDYTLWCAIQHDPFIEKLRRREMLKTVYEQTNSSIISETPRLTNEEISKLEREIAEQAGVAQEDVFIDVPYISTVPYAHATTYDPDDVPVYVREEDRTRKLSDLSVIFSLLKGYYNLTRVYTWGENREKVAAAAREILDNAGFQEP